VDIRSCSHPFPLTALLLACSPLAILSRLRLNTRTHGLHRALDAAHCIVLEENTYGGYCMPNCAYKQQ
jgi:hypothetical protein